MQDVFEHIELMQRSARMIGVFDEETGQTHQIIFTPRWPEQLLTVQLSGNEYGSEFTCFLVLTIVLCPGWSQIYIT
jgi:hypothetical protein